MTIALCDYCRRAAKVADYPLYRAQCPGCAVRSLAASPVFHAAGVAGRLDDPYRKALSRIFGDAIHEGHAMVKAEAARIRAARALL